MLKLLPYILKNVKRNKARTILTVLGVMVAISIFSFLFSLERAMYDTIDRASQNTLLVMTEKDQW